MSEKSLMKTGGIAKVRRFLKMNSSQVSMFVAVALGFIIVSIASPYFLTGTNMKNLGMSMATYGVLAGGVTVSMLLGGLDLSQMSVMAVSSMVIGVLCQQGYPIGVGLLAALVIGILAGMVNGFIVTKMKIVPMIATIGTQMSFRAIASLTTGGNKIRISNDLLDNLAFRTFLGVPIQFWVMILVFIVVFIMMKYTEFGRSVYAIGSNQMAAYLSGIKVNKIKMFAYAITGLSSGLAGILWTAQMRTAVPTAGVGSEFIPISSVIMGGVGLGGGKGNIVGTFFGVALLTIFSNAMTLLNIQAYYQDLLNGLILILAVFIDTVRGGGYKQ
ncbi:ABC transporter permease [Diplocloster hominis]|uniref:ABC transporter permease n=1 Tax=Diplocloster hominis TaxID=3079010 RepID=UPI0031BBBCA3